MRNLIKKFPNIEIRLIPMHYFYEGGDDREFLNEIKFELNSRNLFVQNKNLDLRSTMSVYKDGYFDVGMRFHAVIFQTILNGKNFILDYTPPNKGKIGGFLKDIDKYNFYRERYLNLQVIENFPEDFIKETSLFDKFTYNEEEINDALKVYVRKLKEIVANEGIVYQYTG